MFVSIMAFFAKVSDPVIGGTYMTFLNTISNLGGNWPSTLMLWFVDPLSTKECSNQLNACNGPQQVKVNFFVCEFFVSTFCWVKFSVKSNLLLWLKFCGLIICWVKFYDTTFVSDLCCVVSNLYFALLDQQEVILSKTILSPDQ